MFAQLYYDRWDIPNYPDTVDVGILNIFNPTTKSGVYLPPGAGFSASAVSWL